MRISRRRFLAVFATAALSGSARTSPITQHRFYALGTEAQITLVGGSNKQAHTALIAVEHEVRAIEKAFSLYDPDSRLSHLNRDGHVTNDERFFKLLRHALDMAKATDGAFDPTIQPLWQALALGGNLQEARRAIGWSGLRLTRHTTHFTLPKMALSLNGIAQGYASDRVSAILAHHGFQDTLTDLGEFAIRGAKPDGPWTLGIRAPLTGSIIARIEPVGAIATSEPGSMLIAGRTHIVDPLERMGERWSSVTVEAHEAWRADALSTAIAASPIQKAEHLLANGEASRAWLIAASGKLREWSSS